MNINAAQNGINYTCNAGGSTLATTALDPVDTDLTSATLALPSTALLVMGEMALGVDEVYDQSPAVTGSAPAFSRVSATFSNGGMPCNAQARTDGAYSLDMGDYMPAVGSTVTVQVYDNALRARQAAVVQDGSAFALAFV